MNYIGSISILDRGDAPAQAVIDRNARSLAQRMADETRDELNKVMSRVHNIYGAMETADDFYPTTASMEYLNDLAELEAVLKDEIKKRQYQQQVTVFIVGYQDVCHQKLVLLQQVNEFFMENSKRIDDEDWFPTTPDMDMEEVNDAVETSLNHAHELTNRLADLNKEMVEYMASIAEKKASNKGRKKIEKALQSARDEVSGLSEKLLALQTDLDDREEKVQQLFKQLEAKNMEVQKFRTAAELAKKATADLEVMQKEVLVRDAKIVSQRQQLSKMEVELSQSNLLKQRTETKLNLTDEESQQKIVSLQKELDEQKKHREDIKADMTKLLDNQINALHKSHQEELDGLKREQENQAKGLKEELEAVQSQLRQSQNDLIQLQLAKGPPTDTPSEVARIVDLDSEPSQQASRQSTQQESRPLTKVSNKSLVGGQSTAKSPTRSLKTGESKLGSRTGGSKSDGKEYAEIAIQDEGGDPMAAVVDESTRTPATRQSRRTRSTLHPVLESDFDNAFDLFDEQSWASVSADQLNGRFSQYRRLSTHRLQELEDELQLTTAKTKRKVATLKAQFVEHKTKWETERKILIEQVDQSLRLQGDAEKEADAAMTQLEDFITEQERLEQEEELKRNEVLHASASLTPQGSHTPGQGSADHSPTPGTPHPQGQTITPESEQELRRLMQQTDDAKVQEMNARLGMCTSAPPAVDTDTSTVQKPAQEAMIDAETAGEELEKQEAKVDLSQLKELPLLDIVDAVPSEAAYKSTSSAAIILPSEATRGSSIRDNLDTPFVEIDDPIKMLKEQNRRRSSGERELMDDGSNLEKARSQISEREATQAGSESQAAETFHTVGGDSEPTGPATSSSYVASKQATEASLAGAQKSYLGQSISSLEGAKIEGTTDEEIRASSAMSRASLRETYKVRLEEAKSAAEDRRSRSPAIQLPTQMTVDDELIVDEDDDDDDYVEDGLVLPDDLKEEFLDQKDPSMYEIGTSPPPGGLSRNPTKLSRHDPKGYGREPTDPSSQDPGGPYRDPSQPTIQKIFKKGTSLLEHPLLQEYLRAYDGVVNFKEGMGKIFLDKDMMSAHQMTSDLETLTFDHSQKAMPQVQELTKNIYFVLEELNSLINSILVYDREPPVSSLHLISREQTQKSFTANVDSISEQPVAPPGTRANAGSVASSHHSEGRSGRGSISSDKVYVRDLQEQYNTLKSQLDQDGKLHQEQLQRNTVVMMEMQDTINDLQRELSTLGKSTKRTKSSLSSSKGTAAHQKSPSPEASVMFTRLDSERNAKIMKKAVMDDKLDPEKYKEAVSKMDEYMTLPAQRLAHLVKKYVHHSRMREIENKVKSSRSMTEEVFGVLDKMETLQNQRARQWADRMDEMGLERLKLANLLMDTLDRVEQESGIFLIKPMYSYRGRDVKPSHATKISRPIRQFRNCTPTNDAASSFIPAPTPASNYRLVRHERHFLQQQQQAPSHMAEMKPVEVRHSTGGGNEVKIAGSGMTFSAGSPRTTWNMQASQPWGGKDDPTNAYNTPRILELDINRLLIGQNNISSKVPFPPTDDRLVNANQNSLRSYVTVNRPTASLGGEKTEKRPTSGRDSAGARTSAKKVRVSEIDKEIPASFSTPPPLPPITSPLGETEEEDEEELYEGGEDDGEGYDEVRPPSVAFSYPGDEGHGTGEPPHSPPGSSMYQSMRNEDGDLGEKQDRPHSGCYLSDDET